LKTVREAGYFLPEPYLQIELRVQQLEEILAATPEELVPCNNDLLAENFMDDGKKIWIIDFEYSGQNEASFEIGNLASESFLSDEKLTKLCDAYWQKHVPSKIARAMAWSMIARFGWVLWASIQEAISPIDFDFRTWGLAKWNSVVPELQGSRYQQVLENLKKGDL
jgi:thiamine kinase-like enzyme